MIDKEIFDKITEKYGLIASWAIWGDEGEKPKSNMSNMDVLDPNKNNSLLYSLQPNVIMIGLNFARPVAFDRPYMNFHDASPYANDFKIRYAFKNTPYYGAYMTDLIKNYPMVKSKNVMTYLKKNPDIIQESVEVFRQELMDLNTNKPIIFAFGLPVYTILLSQLEKEYSHLIRLTHYSHQVSKEKYKEEVYHKIETIIAQPKNYAPWRENT